MEPNDSEIARLKDENEALKSKLADLESSGPRGAGFWRTFASVVLIVLACLFALGGALSTWVKTTSLDTDTFVSTVAPLIQDDAVASAVSNIAVDKLFEAYDVEGELSQQLGQIDAAIRRNLPPNAPSPDLSLSAIAGPVASGLENLARTIAGNVLKSDQFRVVWENTLRGGHTAMVNVLTGRGEAVLTSEGNTVVLDLGELISRVKDELTKSGLTFLEKVDVPDNFARVDLFTSEQLGSIKSAVDLLDTLSWLLPLLSIVFFVLGIFAAGNRRKALMGAGIGLAAAMLVTLVVLKVAHREVIGLIKAADTVAAADVIWNTVLSGLKQAVRGFFVLGLFVAVGATIAGPYKWSVWLRSNTMGFFEGRRARREGEGAGKPVNEFVGKYAWWFRAGGFAIALIVLVALPAITALALILTAVILAVYLGIIELLR